VTVLAEPGDAVDEHVDHAPGGGIAAGSGLEWPHPQNEPVVEHVDLQLQRRAVDRRGDRGRGERQLVDAVDRKVEARAETAEDEGDHARAAESGWNGEKDRVRHRTVSWRDDRPSTPTGEAQTGAGSATTIGHMRDVPLTLSTEQADGVAVIRVTGDLDLSTVSAFDAELEQLLTAEHLVVELADCTFIDSSALRALVRAQKLVAGSGGTLALVAPSQPARRVLEIATLDRFVPVFGTVGEAVTSLA
jgi:anti-sigma B factor antagonist